jgi:hypothetical protein
MGGLGAAIAGRSVDRPHGIFDCRANDGAEEIEVIIRRDEASDHEDFGAVRIVVEKAEGVSGELVERYLRFGHGFSSR